MPYFGHRPTYAIDNACIRIAYGKLEIWSITEVQDKRMGLFDQLCQHRLFIIPLFFFPMLADNLQRLRIAFFNFDEPEDGQSPALELEFGIGGYINGKKWPNHTWVVIKNILCISGIESRMKIGSDRKFYFTFGNNSACVESLSKLDILTRELVIVAPAMLSPTPIIFENYWNSLVTERILDLKSRFGNDVEREILTFVSMNYDLFNSLWQLNGQSFDVQSPVANISNNAIAHVSNRNAIANVNNSNNIIRNPIANASNSNRKFKKHADINKHKKKRKISDVPSNDSD